MGEIQLDPDPAAERPNGLAKRLEGLRLPVGGGGVGQNESGFPFGPRRQGARDRPHRLEVALALERAADAEDHAILGSLVRPIGHIQSIGDAADRRAHAREICAKAIGAGVADKGEAGEPPQLRAADGSGERARWALHVGVAMQNHRDARSRRDARRSRQMIFDDREIDPAAPQEPSDAPGFGQIPPDHKVRHGLDLDPLERPHHFRTDDQGRARIAAVTDEVAHAELDRARKLRTEIRAAQEDVGDGRVARHGRTRSRPSKARKRRSLHAAQRLDNRGPDLPRATNFA